MSESTRRTSKIMRGNTLRVYLHLVKHTGGAELREVQRELGLSTPSLASYHLARLIEAGYAEQSADGKYRVVENVSADVLEGYSKMGVVIVPQLFFFSLLLTILFVFFYYESTISPSYIEAFPLIAILAVAILWFETIRLWRRLVTWS